MAYIELVRGVPIITFLFMAAVMFPLFVPHGFTVDKLLRAQVALTMVMAAYLAEVVRAGLESSPRGQVRGGGQLGLPFWPTTILVVLPQALRVTIPALVNTFIGFFKDTSLVAVIGLFDLLGAAKAVIVDRKWVGFGVEVYLFVAAVYFAFCFAVSPLQPATRTAVERTTGLLAASSETTTRWFTSKCSDVNKWFGRSSRPARHQPDGGARRARSSSAGRQAPASRR